MAIYNPCKVKLTNHIMYFQYTMAHNIYYYLLDSKERENNEEILGQRKSEKQLDTLSTLHLHVGCSSELQLSSFLDCQTFLSLGLVPDPVCSSPPRVSQGSGIANILMSPVKTSFNDLFGSLCRDILDIYTYMSSLSDFP